MSSPALSSSIDLNVDLGELPGEPVELFSIATVVNVACGGHAGDEASMRAAVLAARAGGSRVAAHPSYPDREGFGRHRRFASAEVVRVEVASQCGALQRVAREVGGAVLAIKPHGALYHDASLDPALAAAVIEGAREALGDGITVVGPAAGALADGARSAGLDYAREGFADRGLDGAGQLLPRGQPGALIEDPAAAASQALRLVRRGAIDSVCVHGDTPGALAIARAVRAALEELGCLRRRA